MPLIVGKQQVIVKHSKATISLSPDGCSPPSPLANGRISEYSSGAVGAMFRLEHIMLFFLPNILFRNSLYFYLLCSYDSRLFSYYCPIILINLLKKKSVNVLL